MGRASVKEDKNIYQRTREDMRDENGKPWSREKAVDEIAEIENGRYTYLDKYRLLKIEEESVKIQPEDIVALSKAYNKPELRNYYCCHQCDIGRLDVPEVLYDNVHEILVNMSVSLEYVNAKKMRLMEILADGKIDNDAEAADLNKILEELEKISMTVEAMQLWCEKMKLLEAENE